MPDAQGNPLPNEPGFQPAVTLGTGLINQVGAPTTTTGPTAGTTGTSLTQPIPKTPPAPVTPYTVTPYTVPTGGTVAEQVKKIVGEDSPLIEQAKTTAMDAVNARGLINSTAAVNAGEQAVVSAALPIAQADAAAVLREGENTTTAQNTEAGTTAAATNTANLQTTLQSGQTATQAILAAMNNAATLTGTQISTQTSLAIDKIDNANKTALATLQAENQQLLQTNTNAANMFTSTVNNIAAITNNPNLDDTAKANAVASQINLLHEGLKTTTAVASTQQADVASLRLDQFFANAGGVIAAPGGTAAGSTAPLTVVDASTVTQNTADPKDGGTSPQGPVRWNGTNWVLV